MEVRPLTIRIRYCGGCNPEIDRGAVVSGLKQIIRTHGIQGAFAKDSEGDWVLSINGWPRACLEEELAEVLKSPRRISVEGSHLNHRPVTEDEHPQAVWEAIRRGLESNTDSECSVTRCWCNAGVGADPHVCLGFHAPLRRRAHTRVPPSCRFQITPFNRSPITGRIQPYVPTTL